ncbi:sulfite exporter TauE/SafE family protein [Desulfocurvus sp.]|uniref:sulfite exporter TauE/SafE family protein n=1 Tax=Desulfocurvus sp. TaxID=2871698 RepID=UPI0025C58F8F|nr:sulfite exporter TauE/SafE family protein [Desulfocurvus sp.]MCK9240569.1 sulfite exporter TauE/SafE family protein [Desulfocurvus sp.]
MELMADSSWLYMYMPIAGVHIFWPGLVLIGFSVGVIGGFFGMGGAWMVTPGLNILGFPMAFAIGTDIAHIAGKSMVSTMRHSKFGNVDYKLGVVMLAGTMVGIEIGAQLVMWLERLGQVGPVVRWVYVGFLAFIAWMVFYDYAKAVSNKRKGLSGQHGTEGVTWYKALHRINIPPMIHFRASGFTCSAWLPIMVSLVTGILAGFLGIGGGLLRMPALVYLIGCPTHVAVGTDLFEVMISGLYGAFTYTLKGRIEIVAVFVMLTGAAIGAQIGTVATKYSKGYGIRLAFGAAVLCCMLSIILKQVGYTQSAAALILTTIGVICLYIMKIMFVGAARELREKKAGTQIG